MKDLIAKLHSDAADQILATFSTLEMQLQGFAKSSYEKDLRIAELEAQIAAASAPADTDKVREAIFMAGIPTMAINGMNDFSSWESECWARGALAMRVAVLELMNDTALQAPVREVPEAWISVNDRLPAIGSQVIAYRPTAESTHDDAVMLTRYSGVERISWQGISHGFECICHPSHWMPLPAAPVQQEGASNG